MHSTRHCVCFCLRVRNLSVGYIMIFSDPSTNTIYIYVYNILVFEKIKSFFRGFDSINNVDSFRLTTREHFSANHIFPTLRWTPVPFCSRFSLACRRWRKRKKIDSPRGSRIWGVAARSPQSRWDIENWIHLYIIILYTIQ